MSESPDQIYSFGKFRLDAEERLLFDGTDTIPLTPKAFDLLTLLVKNSGRILSKEKIMEIVWEDSFVEENNLAQNISHLRKVLGDGKDGARFIETVSKRGYRFIAPVEVDGEETSDLIIYERTRAKISVVEEFSKEIISVMRAK